MDRERQFANNFMAGFLKKDALQGP